MAIFHCYVTNYRRVNPMNNSIKPPNQPSLNHHYIYIYYNPQQQSCHEQCGFVWKCCVPRHPMVLLIIIPTKWLFHWEYTPFSDKLPEGRWYNPISIAIFNHICIYRYIIIHNNNHFMNNVDISPHPLIYPRTWRIHRASAHRDADSIDQSLDVFFFFRVPWSSWDGWDLHMYVSYIYIFIIV